MEGSISPRAGKFDLWRFDCSTVRGAAGWMDVANGVPLRRTLCRPDQCAGRTHRPMENLWAQHGRQKVGVFARAEFLDNIGPNGADPDYAMGSETEFCLRAQKQGYKLWFAPKPTVQHVVRPHQITPEYCAKRAYRLGRGAALQQWESGILAPRRRSPLFRLAAVPWRAGQRSWLAIRTLRPGAFEHLEARWNYEFYCGFQHEHARQKRLRREMAQMPPR